MVITKRPWTRWAHPSYPPFIDSHGGINDWFDFDLYLCSDWPWLGEQLHFSSKIIEHRRSNYQRVIFNKACFVEFGCPIIRVKACDVERVPGQTFSLLFFFFFLKLEVF